MVALKKKILPVLRHSKQQTDANVCYIKFSAEYHTY